MCYVQEHDKLLMTFSTEMTANAYDDGTIGDSYFGWIDQITTKMLQPQIKVDGLINLSEHSAVFADTKIEGLCVESLEGTAYTINFVADDDQGHTKVFKVKASFLS
jgi:hypothetical protein